MQETQICSEKEQQELISLIHNECNGNNCFQTFVENNMFGGYDCMDKFYINHIAKTGSYEVYCSLNVLIREEFCRLAIKYLSK